MVSGIRELPSFPQVAMKVLRLVRDPSHTAEELSAAISFDPGLSGKLLRLCNSSYYGLRYRVTSIREAIMYLGNRTVMDVVLVSCASDMFRSTGVVYFADPAQLWRHAIGTAFAAELIAQRCEPDLAAMAFTAGLFHDVGKMVLNEHVADRLKAILVHVAGGASMLDAEHRELGMNHAEIGAAIAESWSFPDEFVNAIRYHHDPERAPQEHPLLYCVHVAMLMCHSLLGGAGGDGLVLDAFPKHLNALQLKAKDFAEMAVQLEEKVRRAEEFLSI
ncbi:MAG: HDOD domain-containing protein [Planctomycetota bacterium]